MPALRFPAAALLALDAFPGLPDPDGFAVCVGLDDPAGVDCLDDDVSILSSRAPRSPLRFGVPLRCFDLLTRAVESDSLRD